MAKRFWVMARHGNLLANYATVSDLAGVSARPTIDSPFGLTQEIKLSQAGHGDEGCGSVGSNNFYDEDFGHNSRGASSDEEVSSPINDEDKDIETDLRKGNVWNSFLSLNQQLVDQVKSPSDYKIYRSGLHKLHAELLANKRKPGEQIQGVASLPSVSITTKSNKRKKRITSPKKRRRFSLKGIGIEK
jgi:hypothetical protein